MDEIRKTFTIDKDVNKPIYTESNLKKFAKFKVTEKDRAEARKLAKEIGRGRRKSNL